jgi:hypothetical protein
MGHTSKCLSRLSFAAAILIFAFQFAAAFAQEPSAPQAADPQLIAAAKKLYSAIAAGDVEIVKVLSEKNPLHKITKKTISLADTGPKLKASFDGKVTILRSDGKHAVAAANLYTPDSKDVPADEVKQLRIFLEKEDGQWVATSPDRKEAMDDATLEGGWYHNGAFTFCPNKGLVYTPNHFSDQLHCRAVATCGRF